MAETEDQRQARIAAACVSAVGACVGDPLRMTAIRAIAGMSDDDFMKFVWAVLEHSGHVHPIDTPYAADPAN